MRSPTAKLVLRGNDRTGYGHYGAKRGSRLHKGLDIRSNVGELIFNPIDGIVSKVGRVYSRTAKFKYVEITNDIYRVRVMYVSPSVKVGDRIYGKKIIGKAQDISKYHGGEMINHVHLEIYKHGLLTDPEPLLIKEILNEQY